MITERIGDLLTEPDLTHIAHQANLFHCFGAGLALQIARLFPYAEEADLRTPFGDDRKLGTYSVGVSGDDRPNVVNLYTQDGFGPGSTDLAAMREALENLHDFLLLGDRIACLGLPYRLGCGLAGGSWPKVYGVIEAVFGSSTMGVVIVKLPSEAE